MPTHRLSQWEFVPLTAMLFATIAYSIDAMLPALTVMGAELSPLDPERATLAVGIFVLGMGIGTLFAGPLSDSFGRRPIIILGFAIYILAAIGAASANTLEALLGCRLLQGFAVAGPRIVALALVRDLYKGDQMAAVNSYALSIFITVPAVAPLIGQGLMNAYNWRAIFVSFVVFAVVTCAWFALRQPETLPKAKRNPLSFVSLWSACKLCFSDRVFVLSMIALTLTFSVLFGMVSSVQPIYAEAFDAEDSFPLFFAASAVVSIPGNFLNGRFVHRFGMRMMIKWALLLQLGTTMIALAALGAGFMNIWVFFAWMSALMFCMGFIFPNLTALALEPMGQIAGFAAAINGSLSTMGAAMLAIPIGLSFDGTPFALLMSALVLFAVSYGVMRVLGPRPVE